MLYSLSRSFLRFAFFLLYRLKAVGRENIPDDGPLVICSNHLSNLDPPLLGTPLQRKVHYMAKEELFSIPGFGWLIKQYGAFPVKRGGVSKESIRLAINILQSGNVIGVFPEGSRRNSGGMGKKGAASLAIKANAIVIPAAIIGNYMPFRRMTIVYGEPIDLSAYADGSSKSLEEATELIMNTIRGLVSQHQR